VKRRPDVSRDALVFALACGAVCAIAAGIAGRDLGVPGLYYDEVIQAEPAVQFLAEDGRPSQIPGARSLRLFGGWFPVMIQPYMGALKSHALLPSFALFGATATSLRATTLALGLAGLLFAMLFARAVLGRRVAIVAGALLAVDPSFLFISRHDWGSFALALLCRCAGLHLLASGWSRRSMARLFGGGLCFGLGIYNKIDFAIFAAGAAVAVLIASPRVVAEIVRSRRRPSLAALVGFGIGAAPMIAGATAVFAATRQVARRQVEVSGDWLEKWNTLVATLDGSYFHRLMLAGGSFERMFDFDGASGFFLPAFAASIPALGIVLWRDRRRGAVDPAQVFVWTATLAVGLGLLLMPRAVRIHHALGLYPLPQLGVAIALVRLAGRRGPATALRRGAAVLILGVILAGSVSVDQRTLAAIRASGGKGRWSDAIGRFADELAQRPGDVAVSLDWGFDGPLRFANRKLALIEPIWVMRGARPGRAWSFDGTPQHVYLVFEADLAVFDFGPRFLAMVRNMEANDATVRRHVDREGDLAFLSVRFARPHRLVYSGEFEVHMR